MAGTFKSKIRQDTPVVKSTMADEKVVITERVIVEPESELEIYSKEVLAALIEDGLPPTPNNFSLYFDRLLEEKSQTTRKQIVSILELEEDNDVQNSVMLEQTLKKGFFSIKNILNVAASLYKNMALMAKILEKRKQELEADTNSQETKTIAASLGSDISKLNEILQKQSSNMKTMYDDTAKIIRDVENETVFDNQFGIYNKRYIMLKIAQEIELIRKFGHKSSLIMIELARDIKSSVANEKAVTLMTKTVARLLLKTSRRSDIVAHYGNGLFLMLLKHTDIESAKQASERLCDLVSNSNFFLADREIQLKISIGITDIVQNHSVEEIIVSTMDGIKAAYEDSQSDYAVIVRNN